MKLFLNYLYESEVGRGARIGRNLKCGRRGEGNSHVEGLNLTVAITGASGAIFARELLRALEADERVARVHFVASENSLRVMAEELGVRGVRICSRSCWRGAEENYAACRRGYRGGDCERELSVAAG